MSKARWRPARPSTLLKPVFADRSILKIFHNAKYDLGILARYGLEVVRTTTRCC